MQVRNRLYLLLPSSRTKYFHNPQTCHETPFFAPSGAIGVARADLHENNTPKAIMLNNRLSRQPSTMTSRSEIIIRRAVMDHGENVYSRIHLHIIAERGEMTKICTREI